MAKTEKQGGETPQNAAIPAAAAGAEEASEQKEALAKLEEAAGSVGSAAARLEEEEKKAAAAATEEWAALPQMLGSMLAIYAPEAAKVYTPEACAAWGAAAAPVARKYGWNLSAVGCEAGLVVATLPLALGTFAALRDERERRQGWERYKKHSHAIGDAGLSPMEGAERPEHGGAVGQAPGVKTVVFGSGVQEAAAPDA
ncbi:MAG: hypothetical protein LBU11_04930 [Zoogloeaceae bacterium]|jgi:hypothetical protein|nr:hypothetical protein [Zoogloeaceae bacterium]